MLLHPQIVNSLTCVTATLAFNRSMICLASQLLLPQPHDYILVSDTIIIAKHCPICSNAPSAEISLLCLLICPSSQGPLHIYRLENQYKLNIYRVENQYKLNVHRVEDQ